MDEQSKKAFDFAADLTKQLITLSTSIVTLTLLFSKDVQQPKWMAILIWMLFLISTSFGLWVLMGLTGSLAPASQTPGGKPATSQTGASENPLEIKANVRIPSMLQVVTFGLAILLTLIYVPMGAMRYKAPESPAPCVCKCVSAQSKTPAGHFQVLPAKTNFNVDTVCGL